MASEPVPLVGISLGALRTLAASVTPDTTTEAMLQEVIMPQTMPEGWALLRTRTPEGFTNFSYVSAQNGEILDECGDAWSRPGTKSYLDLLIERGQSADVAQANRFVSHAWLLNFQQLVRSLEAGAFAPGMRVRVASTGGATDGALGTVLCCEPDLEHYRVRMDSDSVPAVRSFNRTSMVPLHSDNEQLFFWLDVVSLNQHQPERYAKGFSDSFMQSIKEIGHVMLVLTSIVRLHGAELDLDALSALSASYEDSRELVDARQMFEFDSNGGRPLTRSWVLWEIYCARQTHSRLQICLPELHARLFIEANAMTKTHNGLAQLLFEVIDSSKAQASRESDRAKIANAIVANVEGGCAGLDALVCEELRAWLLGLNRADIEEEVYTDDLEGRLELLKTRAQMLRQLGQFEEAAKLLEQLLQEHGAHYGGLHRETLAIQSNLASVLLRAGEPLRALELQREALAGFRSCCGEHGFDTLKTMMMLARCMTIVYATQQLPPATECGTALLEEASELCAEAATEFGRLLGDDSEEALMACGNHAGILLQLGHPAHEVVASLESVVQKAANADWCGINHTFYHNAMMQLQAVLKATTPSQAEQSVVELELALARDASVHGMSSDRHLGQVLLTAVEIANHAQPDRQTNLTKACTMLEAGLQLLPNGDDEGADTCSLERRQLRSTFRQVLGQVSEAIAQLLGEEVCEQGAKGYSLEVKARRSREEAVMAGLLHEQ